MKKSKVRKAEYGLSDFLSGAGGGFTGRRLRKDELTGIGALLNFPGARQEYADRGKGSWRDFVHGFANPYLGRATTDKLLGGFDNAMAYVNRNNRFNHALGSLNDYMHSAVERNTSPDSYWGEKARQLAGGTTNWMRGFTANQAAMGDPRVQNAITRAEAAPPVDAYAYHAQPHYVDPYPIQNLSNAERNRNGIPFLSVDENGNTVPGTRPFLSAPQDLHIVRNAPAPPVNVTGRNPLSGAAAVASNAVSSLGGMIGNNAVGNFLTNAGNTMMPQPSTTQQPNPFTLTQGLRNAPMTPFQRTMANANVPLTRRQLDARGQGVVPPDPGTLPAGVQGPQPRQPAGSPDLSAYNIPQPVTSPQPTPQPQTIQPVQAPVQQPQPVVTQSIPSHGFNMDSAGQSLNFAQGGQVPRYDTGTPYATGGMGWVYPGAMATALGAGLMRPWQSGAGKIRKGVGYGLMGLGGLGMGYGAANLLSDYWRDRNTYAEPPVIQGGETETPTTTPNPFSSWKPSYSGYESLPEWEQTLNAMQSTWDEEQRNSQKGNQMKPPEGLQRQRYLQLRRIRSDYDLAKQYEAEGKPWPFMIDESGAPKTTLSGQFLQRRSDVPGYISPPTLFHGNEREATNQAIARAAQARKVEAWAQDNAAAKATGGTVPRYETGSGTDTLKRALGAGVIGSGLIGAGSLMMKKKPLGAPLSYGLGAAGLGLGAAGLGWGAVKTYQDLTRPPIEPVEELTPEQQQQIADETYNALKAQRQSGMNVFTDEGKAREAQINAMTSLESGGQVPRYRFGAMGLVPFVPGAAAVASAALLKPWQKNKSTFERALAGTMGAAGLAGMGYGAYRMFNPGEEEKKNMNQYIQDRIDREEDRSDDGYPRDEVPYHNMPRNPGTDWHMYRVNSTSDDGAPGFTKMVPGPEGIPSRVRNWFGRVYSQFTGDPLGPELVNRGTSPIASDAQGGEVPRYAYGSYSKAIQQQLMMAEAQRMQQANEMQQQGVEGAQPSMYDRSMMESTMAQQQEEAQQQGGAYTQNGVYDPTGQMQQAMMAQQQAMAQQQQAMQQQAMQQQPQVAPQIRSRVPYYQQMYQKMAQKAAMPKGSTKKILKPSTRHKV